jgi:hypothetical protein
MSGWGNAAGITPKWLAVHLSRERIAGGNWRARPERDDQAAFSAIHLFQAVDDWCVSGVLDLALVRQGGSNCRYSDLAIAAVEIRLVAAGVIVALRRIVLGHLLLRRNSHWFV